MQKLLEKLSPPEKGTELEELIGEEQRIKERERRLGGACEIIDGLDLEEKFRFGEGRRRQR